MLVLKDVFNLVHTKFFRGGGRVPTGQVPYRHELVLFKSWELLSLQTISLNIFCGYVGSFFWLKNRIRFHMIIFILSYIYVLLLLWYDS